MSGSLPSLDIQEQIARIDRAIAETQKFQLEQNKLFAEGQKYQAEQSKLIAEGQKFARERFLAPVLAASVLGGMIAAAVPAILRALAAP